ncbi:MAG: hypothetical protein V3V45_01145, partial [Candidatus Brocadiales bacterium]
MAESFDPSCPVPFSDGDKITLAHGSGGMQSAELISKLFVPALDNEYLKKLHDGAVFDLGNVKLAFTTDS